MENEKLSDELASKRCRATGEVYAKAMVAAACDSANMFGPSLIAVFTSPIGDNVRFFSCKDMGVPLPSMHAIIVDVVSMTHLSWLVAWSGLIMPTTRFEAGRLGAKQFSLDWCSFSGESGYQSIEFTQDGLIGEWTASPNGSQYSYHLSALFALQKARVCEELSLQRYREMVSDKE